VTTITVNDVGGGGGSLPGSVEIIGDFNAGNQTTCFRIKPVNGSFDVRNANLSSITLEFDGESIAALSGGAQLELNCHSGGGGGDGDDDSDNDNHHHGDGGGDRHKDDNKRHHAGTAQLGGDHPRGDDGHDGDDDGDNDNEDGDGNGGGGNGTCDAVAIRACFSTQALLSLFAGATLPRDLANAEIHLTLANGATVVATFDGNRVAKKEKKDKEGRGGGDRVMNPKAKPNPLNPRTELSFTLSREGRVRVTVFDMQGRLVNTLLDEVRSAGVQTLAWDGSNAHSQRVASGVYLLRIQAPEGEVIQRVAVVK
jgi:hypothetical protein